MPFIFDKWLPFAHCINSEINFQIYYIRSRHVSVPGTLRRSLWLLLVFPAFTALISFQLIKGYSLISQIVNKFTICSIRSYLVSVPGNLRRRFAPPRFPGTNLSNTILIYVELKLFYLLCKFLLCWVPAHALSFFLN